MSGKALAARLAVEQPELRRRLIVMTGGAVTPEDEEFLSRGDVLVLAKPVGHRELNEALALALGPDATEHPAPSSAVGDV
jgi:FixJ family two-component response regulator